VETTRNPSTPSLRTGTTMLAVNTIAASPHEPRSHRNFTPDRMVSARRSGNCSVYMIVSAFAGKYSARAAMTSAST